LHFAVGDEENFSQNRERVQIVQAGQPLAGRSIQEDCKSILREKKITVEVNLGVGTEEAVVWTCDLSDEYVKINSDYTT